MDPVRVSPLLLGVFPCSPKRNMMNVCVNTCSAGPGILRDLRSISYPADALPDTLSAFAARESSVIILTLHKIIHIMY